MVDGLAFLVGAWTKLYDDVKDRGLVSDTQEPRVWWLWALKAALVAGFAVSSCRSDFVAGLLSVIFVGCALVGQLDRKFWRVLALIPPAALVLCHRLRVKITPLRLLTALVAIAVIRFEASAYPEEESQRKTAFRMRSMVLLSVLSIALQGTQIAFILPFLCAGLGYLLVGLLTPTTKG